MVQDDRMFAPSAARNRQPVFDVLQPLLPSSGLVLEVASGSGEHITGLAGESGPELQFQPSDPDARARQSIDAWRDDLGLGNVRDAIVVDASAEAWPVEQADLVFCMNMIHISPWTATEGLFRGAARVLPLGGVLFTYGPYRRGGVHTSPGNEAFDAELRQRDALWGIRDVEQIATLAEEVGLSAPEIVEMPANNLSLIFRRT